MNDCEAIVVIPLYTPLSTILVEIGGAVHDALNPLSQDDKRVTLCCRLNKNVRHLVFSD